MRRFIYVIIINIVFSAPVTENTAKRVAEQKVIDEWVKYQNGGNLNRRSNNVDPLITAEFDQGAGWNAYCPEDSEGPGGHALVGGFEVALAQIMHYWSWPTQGEGYNGYTSPYGFLQQDFSSAYYDYDVMEETVPTDATAQLLSDLGIALETIYGVEASNYNFDDDFLLLSILPRHFFYQDKIEDVRSWDYDWSEYFEILKNELDNSRPFIYAYFSGWSWTPSMVFVVDGYNEEDQFHINWGQGGEGNGYFTLDEGLALINIIPMNANEPVLRLESSTFNEIDGDEDFVNNPGEKIEFITSFYIPPIFANAGSITIELETSEPGISILDFTSNYGSLNAGDTLSNISDPFILEIDSNITFGSKDIILNAISYSGENSYETQYEFEFDVSLYQYGFPQTIQFKKSTPLVIDYDNDGNKEIIVGDTHGKVRVFNKDGSEILNDDFPYDTGGQIWGSPAAADMDGDGFTDFVIPSKSTNVYIFDKTGLKAQYSAGYYLLGTPAIGNLDEDEDLEFVIASYGGGAGDGNGVWAINPDGSIVNGFPIDITPEKVKAGVALADFNGNGRDDIVFGTDDGNLYLYYDDGILAEGFPFSTGDRIQSSPGILNMNGQKIIFFGSEDNFFYAVNSDGSLRFSIEANDDIFISPAFLFYQERYFVFFGDDSGMIYAVDIAGNSLSGWPLSIGDSDHISSSVVFSDLNGDEEPEVIVISDDGKCFVYDIAGNIAEGFPLNNESSFISAPVVIDIDSDNDLEIMGASVNHLSMYDIKTSGSTLNYWNLYQGNNRRAGFESGDECMTEFDCAGVCGGNAIEDCAGECGGSAELDECDICDSAPSNDCIQDCAGEWGGEAVVDECGECGGDGPTDGLDCDGNQLSLFNSLIPEDFSIHSIYPNPFNPITNITYGIPEYVNVQITIYDLSGKQVHTLINKPKTPGYYLVNWNASAHPSGIYLIKMKSGNYSHTQKVILIK